MNLLNRTCAIGAQPIGAPGCPELALNVASTCSMVRDDCLSSFEIRGTNRQHSNGVNGLPIKVVVRHLDVVDRNDL